MGLREVKKERTRKAIEDAAIALFAERGYQATTLADIAEVADIAPRTFFAYFRSKEEVLFSQADETFAALAEHLRTRPEGESTFDSLRRWIGELIDELGMPDERERQVRCIIEDNDVLLAHERHLMGRFEGLLVESVAADLGDDPGDLRPRMVGAAATAALWSMRESKDRDDAGTPAEVLARLDEAIVFLRSGTNALQRRRRASAR